MVLLKKTVKEVVSMIDVVQRSYKLLSAIYNYEESDLGKAGKEKPLSDFSDYIDQDEDVVGLYEMGLIDIGKHTTPNKFFQTVKLTSTGRDVVCITQSLLSDLKKWITNEIPVHGF